MRTNLLGMEVIVHNGVMPKMQLSPDVMVSDDVRESTNKWMLEFFGSDPIIPDGQVLIVGNNKIFCNPATAGLIRSIKC